MTNIRFSKQVDKKHYFSETYLNNARFLGLQSQINLSLKLDGINNILEIGPGPGLYSTLMKNLGFKVTTLDFEKDLSPNVIGSIPDIPFKKNSFDLIAVFEVLEHIPFLLFEKSILELSRVSRKNIIFSVPSQKKIFASEFYMEIKLGKQKLKKNFFSRKINRLTNPEEHYWEIGYSDVTERLILEKLNNINFTDVESIFKDPYFQFFIIKKPD